MDEVREKLLLMSEAASQAGMPLHGSRSCILQPTWTMVGFPGRMVTQIRCLLNGPWSKRIQDVPWL